MASTLPQKQPIGTVYGDRTRRSHHPYSRNAVLFLRSDGERVGYLPEVDAAELASLIDGGARHVAEVKKILPAGGSLIPMVWDESHSAESSEGEPSPRVPFVDIPREAPPLPTQRPPLAGGRASAAAHSPLLRDPYRPSDRSRCGSGDRRGSDQAHARLNGPLVLRSSLAR